jgi:hypothetical protein
MSVGLGQIGFSMPGEDCLVQCHQMLTMLLIENHARIKVEKSPVYTK